jgi:hypothetical protein
VKDWYPSMAERYVGAVRAGAEAAAARGWAPGAVCASAAEAAKPDRAARRAVLRDGESWNMKSSR